MKRCYIAGPIKDNPDYRARFDEGVAYVEKLGYAPVNPCDLDESMPDASYEEYVRWGLVMLLGCQAIYMLDGWQKSKGACLERRVAKACGMEVLYEAKRLQATG